MSDVYFVQLKQEVIDELMFTVEYDKRNDALKIISQPHVRNQYLSKTHVELYYNPLQLEDEIFEWKE